ncbi:MAG: glycosyltransferase family 2 protein [Candidatus Bathyarchaeia archaeon]
MSSRVTVGICAYNEGKNIGKLLNRVLTNQDLAADAEVLVVCSGCTDSTVDTAREHAARDSRVKVQVEAERRGKASAVNHILANAHGNVILFISADTLPAKGSFSHLFRKLRSSNVGIVSGNPVPVNRADSLVGRLVQLLWRFHNHVFHELNDAGLARHATEIFCVRKGIVDRIPAATVNDDAYIAVTAKKKGWLIKYAEASKVFIRGPETFREYFQQRRRIIFGHYQLRRLTGEAPQYLVHLMPLHPMQVMRLALWLSSRYDLPTLAVFLFTEFLANVAAIGDFFLGRAYFRWGSLPSTKTLPL